MLEAQKTLKVGIVGASIAGLACAARLAEFEIGSVLFDKGKRAGGRLSTLQVGDLAWDFGAQHFVPSTPAFAAVAAKWENDGLVARWPAGPRGALVGVPGMGSLVADLCSGHDVRFDALVTKVEAGPHGWQLHGPDVSAGPFAAVAIAVPAEQAAALLALHDLELAQEAATIRSIPSWSLMATFAETLEDVPDVLRDLGPITWAARNSSKPRRGASECWVIQATPQWSQSNLELDREAVADALLALFAESSRLRLPAVTFSKAHLWRYARPVGQNRELHWNEKLRLGACGDWCLGNTIESAWHSGHQLAESIAACVGPKQQ